MYYMPPNKGHSSHLPSDLVPILGHWDLSRLFCSHSASECLAAKMSVQPLPEFQPQRPQTESYDGFEGVFLSLLLREDIENLTK